MTPEPTYYSTVEIARRYCIRAIQALQQLTTIRNVKIDPTLAYHAIAIAADEIAEAERIVHGLPDRLLVEPIPSFEEFVRPKLRGIQAARARAAAH